MLNKRPRWPAPIKKNPKKPWALKSFKSSPSKEFPRCSHSSLLKELSMSRVTSLEEESWKLCLVTPDVTHVPFLFADCTSKTFTVISHRPKYNYMLSSVSHNMWWGREVPEHPLTQFQTKQVHLLWPHPKS